MLPIGCVLVDPFSHAVWRLLSLRVHALESFVVVQGIPLDVDVFTSLRPHRFLVGQVHKGIVDGNVLGISLRACFVAWLHRRHGSGSGGLTRDR